METHYLANVLRVILLIVDMFQFEACSILSVVDRLKLHHDGVAALTKNQRSIVVGTRVLSLFVRIRCDPNSISAKLETGVGECTSRLAVVVD